MSLSLNVASVTEVSLSLNVTCHRGVSEYTCGFCHRGITESGVASVIEVSLSLVWLLL